MGNPVYHLKPNKAVDRNLFIEGLLHLRKIEDLSAYRYIGFGSYEFDEFKMIHRSLGIEDLHSIEMDTDVFRRQRFNKPYAYIQLFNKTCGEYFDEDFDGGRPSIVWADFSEANEKYSQCLDVANICSKMHRGDILRITLNANPAAIPTGDKPTTEVPTGERKRHRFDYLKSELNEFFPDDVSEDDLTRKKYPIFLLKALKRAVYKDLDKNLFPCPICSHVYSDDTQMLTITLYICEVEGREQIIEKLKNAFKDWGTYVRIDEWNDPIIIDLPALTVHEQLEIGQYEKNESGEKKIEEKMGIKPDELNRYLKFASYYPNYQPVVI